jgi:hypothetical protein
MTAKVCPRCGTQYEDLKSTTCPECFARLLIVDEIMAEELRAARDSVVQTPEFQATKAVDDERFREQSFGACLGVAVIALVTVIVIAVVIGLAAHRNRQASRPTHSTARPLPAASGVPVDLLTTLPVAAATLNDVLPPTVGPYQRVKSDQTITLSGTLTPLFHASYSSRGETLQVYAVPTSLSTPLQNQFRQGVELAAQIEAGGADRPEYASTQSFVTEHWRYAVIGPLSGTADTSVYVEDFRQSLGAYFRQLSP